jgi:cobalt-zinc-cadmium efflux system membrane fusion protein
MTNNNPTVAASTGHTPFTPVRLAIAALVVVAGATAVASLGRHAEPVAETAPFAADGTRVEIRSGAPTWTYLDFAQATLQPPLQPAPVPGRVLVDEARSQPIEAPLAGRVENVAVKLGERVEKGARLVAVRSPDLVDLGREFEEMRAAEATRSKTVERLRSLVALSAEPEKKLMEAEQELKTAQLARAAAESKLHSLSADETSDGLYWLTAPRAGVVVTRNVLAGQQVGPDRTDPLLEIAELDEVIVAADVPEQNVRDLHVGAPAHVLPAAGGDRAIDGTIEYVGEVVDPQRRMVDVRVRVANAAHELRPNAFVQVAFAPQNEPRVVVPAEAVVTDDQESFVFVRPEGGNKLERRSVTLGRQHDDKVEIASGLTPGDTYVTKGALLLLNAVDLASQ